MSGPDRPRFARKAGDQTQYAGFNEGAYGFPTFSDMLLEAQKRGLLKLEATKVAAVIFFIRRIERSLLISARYCLRMICPSGRDLVSRIEDQRLKAETRD